MHEPHTHDDQTRIAELADELYAELRKIAHRTRAGIPRDSSLQTTALIHEAYLKLKVGDSWKNRSHFLASAALAMRQILVDNARSHLRVKRGRGEKPLPIDAYEAQHQPAADAASNETVIAVHQALEQLQTLNPRLVRLVECRYFAGYTLAETATALGVTERTVRRDWVLARAFLYKELSLEVTASD